MTVQIAVTVCDCSDAAHAGGDPHRVTQIVTLTDEQVPPILRLFVSEQLRSAEHAEKYNVPAHFYQSVTLSIVV